ncbi:MAG: hypothetical protein M3024_14335 [Candidatus Dormibacteraeota bacterium]|nr:hypothetical protein [Candidatus Dormibacteraeota bacterium]
MTAGEEYAALIAERNQALKVFGGVIQRRRGDKELVRQFSVFLDVLERTEAAELELMRGWKHDG